jgi:hypothetical protein
VSAPEKDKATAGRRMLATRGHNLSLLEQLDGKQGWRVRELLVIFLCGQGGFVHLMSRKG